MFQAFATMSKRVTRRPEVELLEDRRTPALVGNGIDLLLGRTTELTITATANPVQGLDRVVVTPGTKLEFVGGQLVNVPSLDVFNNGSRVMQFKAAGITGVRFNGSTLADFFVNASSLPSFQNGGGGNDTLTGGSNNDTLQGSNGNDSLDGGGGGVDTVVETADADFSLTSLSDSGASTMDRLFSHHSGQDELRNIDKVQLTGGPSANKFFTSTYLRTVGIDGAGGDDYFLVGPGQESVTGGPGTDTLQMFVQSNLNYQALSNGDSFVGQGLGIDNAFGIEKVIADGSNNPNQIDLGGFKGVAVINGNGGNDTLRGGDGNDSVFGGDGNDILVESGGNDLLDGGAGDDPVFGLADRRLTPSELNVNGEMAVLLRTRIEPLTQRQIRTLEVAGPSGAGFRLEGDWTVDFPNGAERFSAVGQVILKSALGDISIPVPSQTPLRFQTRADSVPNFGVLADRTDVAGFTRKDVSWNSGPGLNTADPGSPLRIVKETVGLDLQTPGASWGLALGSQLGHLDAPLNPAVPYIFFTVGTDFAASFGDVSVSAGGGVNLTVVFDPSDPFLYAAASVPTDFDVGYSHKGYIPYHPDQTLPGNPAVFGNFTANVTVDLGAVPVTLRGGFVLDLDANDDGQRLGFTADNLTRLARGQLSYDQFVGAGINDVAFGLNGGAGVGYSKAGFNLSLETAKVSAAFTPGVGADPAAFTFHGGMTNPFSGTPLEVFNFGTYEAQGRIAADGNFDVSLTAGLGGLLGTLVPNRATLNLTNQGVFVDAEVRDVLGFGNVEVTGQVTFDGKFTLRGEANAGVELKIPLTDILLLRANLHAEAIFTNQTGPVTFNAALSIDPLDVGPNEILNFRGRLEGNLSAGAGGFSASGAVVGNVNNIPFVGTAPVNIGWTLSNSEVSVQLAEGLAFTFRFNTAPAFEQRIITQQPRVGDVVTLTGRITEVDPLDEFILDVNWGDGTTETFTFPEGKDGDEVSVTHRYTTTGANTVTALWRDPAGASNSAILGVTVLEALQPPTAPPTDTPPKQVEPVRPILRVERRNGKRMVRVFDALTGQLILQFDPKLPSLRRGRTFQLPGSIAAVRVVTGAGQNGKQPVQVLNSVDGTVLARFTA